jgi:hypothetical protein
LVHSARTKADEDFADGGANGVDGSRGGFAQKVLDLGENRWGSGRVSISAGRRAYRQPSG